VALAGHIEATAQGQSSEAATEVETGRFWPLVPPALVEDLEKKERSAFDDASTDTAQQEPLWCLAQGDWKTLLRGSPMIDGCAIGNADSALGVVG
jgi:hypothetical protein